MLPDTFVCWLWPTSGYRTQFTPAHVNVLRRMIARHFDPAHRFVCVTNIEGGFDAGVERVRDREDFANVPSPHGSRWPRCYRRLRAFAPGFGDDIGSTRFVSLDIDTVITGDLVPLFDRDEDFVGWQDPNKPNQYCGSIFMMTAGSHPEVWNNFRPQGSSARAAAAGYMGSDQAWFSYCIPNGARWTRDDGIVSFRKDLREGVDPLPADARLVAFHGRFDPWDQHCQRLDWVREHWR